MLDKSCIKVLGDVWFDQESVNWVQGVIGSAPTRDQSTQHTEASSLYVHLCACVEYRRVRQAWVAVRMICAESGLESPLAAAQSAGCTFAHPPVPKGSKRVSAAQQHHHTRRQAPRDVHVAAHSESLYPSHSQPVKAEAQALSRSRLSVQSWLESTASGGTSGQRASPISQPPALLPATVETTWQSLPQDVWRSVLALLPTPAVLKFGLVSSAFPPSVSESVVIRHMV